MARKDAISELGVRNLTDSSSTDSKICKVSSTAGYVEYCKKIILYSKGEAGVRYYGIRYSTIVWAVMWSFE